MEKQLLESIDRLAELVGMAKELSENIYEKIKEKMKDEPMHNTYIYHLKYALSKADYFYTKFHTDFFGKSEEWKIWRI